MAKLLVWGLGLLGALASIAGAAMFWAQESRVSGDRIWPLPALVLIEWALLGAAGFAASILAVRSGEPHWSDIAWLASGALLPMAVLGGFSIGPLVFLSLLPLLGAAVGAAWRCGTRVSRILGYFGIGAIANLGVMLLLIILAGGG